MALPTPIAYWPFNEATGTTTADASGQGHTATIVNGTWNTALKRFGAAALANTATGYSAGFTAMNLGTVHTISVWINGWDGSNDGVVIGGASQFYGLYLDGTQIYYSAGASNYALRPHGGGLTGAHHLAVVRNGLSITFYKDGATLTPASLNGGTNAALNVWSIGGYDHNSTLGFAATLDDLRLYDVALTGAQVSELYALNPDLAQPVPDVKGKSQAAAVADLIAAGLVPGQITKEKNDKVPPGHVIRQDPEPPVVVPTGTPVNLVISDGAAGGIGPIANLPGKVTATHALLVSAAVSTSLSASLEGATAYTDAVLIPAPGPTERILVRRLSASTLVAGPFSVRFASNGTPVRGPIWLPSGAAAQTTGRLFTTGPTAIVLPPGQGLTVTTSANAPQTIEADYEIVGT